MKQISYQMHPDTTKQELIDHLFDLSLILQDRPKTGWWHVDHKYNHSDKHFDKTQDELIESLIERNLNTQKHDRTDAASSFDTGVVSKENILAESILDNMEEIADWLLSDDDCLLDINTQIKDEKTGKPIDIGYGFANGLKGFSTNNARVVLTKEFNNPEGFAIRTMYPFFDKTHSMYNGVDGLKLLHRNETFKNASPAQQDYIRTLITHRNIYARQQKDSGEIRYVVTDTKNKNAPIRYTVYDKKEENRLAIGAKDGHNNIIKCPYAKNPDQKGLLTFPDDIDYEKFQNDFPHFCETINISQKIIEDERTFRKQQRKKQANTLKEKTVDKQTEQQTQRQPE